MICLAMFTNTHIVHDNISYKGNFLTVRSSLKSYVDLSLHSLLSYASPIKQDNISSKAFSLYGHCRLKGNLEIKLSQAEML